MINKFKDFIWLVIGGIGLIIVVYVACEYAGNKQYKPDNSQFIFETSVRYVDKPIYITKIKAKLDTIRVIQYVGDTGDSAYVPIQVAYADTLLKQDSSSVKITYYYPPRNYFDLDLNIKEKVITHEITKILPYEPKFFDRFNYGFYLGCGYDFINKQPVISAGFSITLDIGRVF